MNFFEHIERTANGLIVGGMRPPGVLKIRGREHQHLATTVVAKIVIALFVPRGARPVEEVLLLSFWLLRKEVVREPNRELSLVRQLLDDGIVFGIVLKAAAGVNSSGHAEAVELAQEVARRIELVVEGQLRTLGQSGVENGRVGLGQ